VVIATHLPLTSPRPGRYLGADQLAELVAPPREWTDAVMQWLDDHGVHDYHLSRNSDYIHMVADLPHAQTLLQCNFTRYRHE